MSTTTNDAYIRFTTRNSEYLFTWRRGERTGILTGISGTCANTVITGLLVEDFRDLCWPGEVVRATDQRNRTVFESSPVVQVTRTSDFVPNQMRTYVAI